MDANTNSKQKVTCIANYAYEASEADELSLQPGDVVTSVERRGGGWWRGELRGRAGMFPDNFVSLIDQANVRSGGVQGRCRAVFSYQPANADELSLAVGDVLDVLGEVEEGWWQGRRLGKVGVFPSNFVVMLDQPTATTTFEPAPALPPKPVKEVCRVVFPYVAVNEDELSLAEGDLVVVTSREAPDRGWWRGELRGRHGLFPDNFVQLLPANTLVHEEEKKLERPSTKNAAPLYPVLNKYSEKTSSVKELTTNKVSLHKESVTSKESSTHTSITHSSKNETEKLTNNEVNCDTNVDGQGKKPPLPTKKSPTPSGAAGGVVGLLSGLKNKMLSNSDKEKSVSSSGSNSSGEWDKPDGVSASRAAAGAAPGDVTTSRAGVPGDVTTFDRVQRNSILNDPRAQRVKAPRRRPPSQALRDDTLQQIGLSNGHDAESSLSAAPPPGSMAGSVGTPSPSPERHTATSATEQHAGEEIKPRAREWEKHRAPWMAELKLNQAKKTPFIESGKSKSVSSEGPTVTGSKGASGSTDRLLDVGVEDKKTTHSMEMSKSTSSITNRISVMETFEESKTRHSLDSMRESVTIDTEVSPPRPAAHTPVVSPTAAGRTLTTMLEEIKRPHAAPSASLRTSNEFTDKQTSMQTNMRLERLSTAKHIETSTGNTSERLHTVETIEKTSPTHNEKPLDRTVYGERTTSSVERRLHSAGRVPDRADVNEALIAQLNDRITNLEKLVEVQAAKYSAAIEDLTRKLAAETDKRLAIQTEMEKLAHCVTQV